MNEMSSKQIIQELVTGNKALRSKIQIPSVDFNEEDPHGCLWEARLIAYEVRRTGKHDELLFQTFSFRCGVCSTTFNGTRTFQPDHQLTINREPLDPQFIVESDSLVIQGSAMTNNIFTELFPQTLPLLFDRDYIALRKLPAKALGVESEPQSAIAAPSHFSQKDIARGHFPRHNSADGKSFD